MSTEFKAGDKVVCFESESPYVTTNKEYDLEVTDYGSLCFTSDNNEIMDFNIGSDGIGMTNTGSAKFKKVEKMEDINIGDLVYIIDTVNKVRIGECIKTGVMIEILESRTGDDYYGFGFKATPDKRQGLVALYGEFAVPKLPPSPNEIMIELLKGGSHTAMCSNQSYSAAREGKNIKLVESYDKNSGYFYTDNYKWEYVIAVDSRGNEITELGGDDE